MKKLLLTLVVAILFAFTTMAQSYIGQSSYYIKNDVIERYGSLISTVSQEGEVLSIAFSDGRSAIYILNSENKCKYYCLCYPNSFAPNMNTYLNGNLDKITNQDIWYEKVESTYVYYEVILRDKIFWLVIYPDFFVEDAKELKRLL